MPKFTITPEVIADRKALEALVRLDVFHTVMTAGSNKDREDPLPAVDKFSEHILKPLRKVRKPADGKKDCPPADGREKKTKERTTGKGRKRKSGT